MPTGFHISLYALVPDARHIAVGPRVSPRLNNRDRFGCRYSRPRGRRADSKNVVDGKRYQFGRRRLSA